MAQNAASPSFINALRGTGIGEFQTNARPLDMMPGQPGVDFGGRIPNKVPGAPANMEQIYADMLRKSSETKRLEAPQGPVAQPMETRTPSGTYGESLFFKRMSDEDKIADFMRTNPFGGLAPFFGVYPQHNETWDQFQTRVKPMYSRTGQDDPFAYLDQPMWG